MSGLPRQGGRRAIVVASAVLALALAGCGGGPILANPPLDLGAPPTAAPTATPLPDPQPIVLAGAAGPGDEAPHHRLTEWWYYTGHLADADGGRYGFEVVVFRAERGDLPVSWASHLALTDETGHRFLYAQRSWIGQGVDVSATMSMPIGFALAMPARAGTGAATPGAPAWSLLGTPDGDRISAGLTDAEAQAAGGSFALDLALRSSKPAVLHDRDGWIDFGPAGGSYYYSRTRMAADGTVTLDGKALAVTGTAWFDHQWGDFISVGGGGWDWFAVNLEDGTDLTLSLVRSADGTFPLVYGTLVDAAGAATHLERTDFTVEQTGTWTSPRTGAVYPAGWRITLPDQDLEIELTPTLADQELDTRATTGVVYWEGSQVVSARRRGVAIGGEAYVELTGYAPALPAASPAPSAAIP